MHERHYHTTNERNDHNAWDTAAELYGDFFTEAVEMMVASTKLWYVPTTAGAPGRLAIFAGDLDAPWKDAGISISSAWTRDRFLSVVAPVIARLPVLPLPAPVARSAARRKRAS